VRQFFEPIGKKQQDFSPRNPFHLWKLRRELLAYSKWFLGKKFARADHQQVPGMDRRLAEHVAFALDIFPHHAKELSAAFRKHQLTLADRQSRMAELSLRVQDTVVLLVTALWAHGQKKEIAIASADVLCRDLRRKLTGQRPSDSYFRAVNNLADQILAGGFENLAQVPREEILMKY